MIDEHVSRRALMMSTEHWKLEPSNQLVSGGWCLANPGREYQNAAAPFRLEITGTTGPLKAVWFNPLTGARTAAGELNNGQAKLSPPADWGDAPLVLHARLNP